MKPPFTLYRFIGSIIFGYLLAWTVYSETAVEGTLLKIGFKWRDVSGIPDGETLFGISLKWLHVLIPFAAAVGVHTVGNIGREKGSLKSALIGAYAEFIPYLFQMYFYTFDKSCYYAILGISVSAALVFRYYVQWNRDQPQRQHICKRFLTISACILLYISLHELNKNSTNAGIMPGVRMNLDFQRWTSNFSLSVK